MNEGFWKGPIYRVVEKMKASGNQPGVIEYWRAMLEAWANSSKSADAEAVRAWLPLWQARPFYTAAELAPVMPALAVALGVHEFTGRMPPQMSPRRLAIALEVSRLPYVYVQGTQYFVVEQTHRAKELRPMIEEYHNAQHG